MLNTNRLRVLWEIAERGSFSGAAQALSYTQSAVSQQIATLESELGTPLIERRPRGLRMTAAGQALLEHAEGILARIAAAEAELAAINGLRGGQLRMASFPTAGATLMPLAIASFSARHPDVELSLAEAEPEEIVPRLRGGEFDLALLFEFSDVTRPPGSQLEQVDLLEDPMYVALPAAHRLAGKRALRLEDLRDEAWVQTSAQSPCARHVMRSCHQAGFEPNVSFESDDYQTVQGLVSAGVGVALIPELALPYVGENITVRALSPQSPVRKVTAATPAGPRQTPAARAMLAVLQDAAGRYLGQRREVA
ncbi:MAG: LysR family transcriptional regulator [Solirubrobacteraceae bacterium]|nr:MAG: LysR family transcriptional regulator [Solirubrobacterales bacterium]